MKKLSDLKAIIEIGNHGATDKISDDTASEIERLSADGYRIIVGNNPFLDRAKKYAGMSVVRISHVNSRFHGRCIRTIWAVK